MAEEKTKEPVDTRTIFDKIAAEASANAKTKAQIEAEEQRGMKRDARAERLEASGVKEAITPDDFDRIVRGDQHMLPTYAYRTVRGWHQLFTGFREGKHVPITVLYGLTGRGKTVAGAWLLAQEGGVYITAPDLRHVMTSGHWSDAKRKDSLVRSRVVVLDDLGTEEHDGKAQTALFLFANARQGIRSGLSLVTANLALAMPKEPEKGLMTRYDERTMARFQHVGRLVEATGEDLRRKV